MGVMIELVTIFKTSLSRFRGASGATVNASATGLGGVGIEAEYLQAGGVMHRPGKATRSLFIPVGRNRRYGVIFGAQNYNVSISVEDGETVIYSTTADGKTVKAKIKLDASGNIELNGNTNHLVTHEGLDTALQNFKASIDTAIAGAITGHTHTGNLGAPTSSGTGAAPPVVVDITAAKTEKVKTG